MAPRERRKMVYRLALLSPLSNLFLILTPYAKMRRNKPFATEIHDIYEEYKNKKGSGMRAPGILVPPSKIRSKLSSNDIKQ